MQSKACRAPVWLSVSPSRGACSYSRTAQVQLSIKCDTTTSSLTLDPCAGISAAQPARCMRHCKRHYAHQPRSLDGTCRCAGHQVFAQGHPLNTTCTRRGCPFGMQHPTPMTNAAPFPCVACAPPDFSSRQAIQECDGLESVQILCCLSQSARRPEYFVVSSRYDLAPLPALTGCCPAKQTANPWHSVLLVVRSQAGTCLPCPHGAASEERGARFPRHLPLPARHAIGNDACSTCLPGFYQPETRAAVACQACATAKLHGATPCESDTACQNGVLRSDGVCDAPDHGSGGV